MYSHDTLTAFRSLRTPFYYYDLSLLQETLVDLHAAAEKHRVEVHYAMKANTNTPLLKLIRSTGFGADCVSGNEVRAALKNGFSPEKIVFAGVGKTDEEIVFALRNNIACFNVESIAELQVIDELATRMGKHAPVALRINPDVDAMTHAGITTGTRLVKFGISLDDIPAAIEYLRKSTHLAFKGLHFHIGSQITDLQVVESLSVKVNRVQEIFIQKGLFPETINLGGGLGIDYEDPDHKRVPDFDSYFAAALRRLNRLPGQRILFEPGRSVVGQCGTLVSTVLYLKRSGNLDFVILDAGMNHLLRPALYGAYHKIQNLMRIGRESVYQVAGPICETSDIFGRNVSLPETRRGDLLAIRSAGAYGEVMASDYNLRDRAPAVYSTDFGTVSFGKAGNR